MNNLDFVSNERVIDLLSGLLDCGRFPHAVVIEGEQGLGKKTLASLLATALVCRGENKPCMQCVQCHKAVEKIHPDIYEYASKGGGDSFHVDTIRKIISEVYLTPNEAEYKVFILENAHCMSLSAQNALLKVLEEPPSYVVFILTVQSKSMLIDTILSRCTVFTLEGVDSEKGAKYICSHFEDIDYDGAKAALETFDGNIGRTVDSLLQGKETKYVDACCEICKALIDEHEYSLMCALTAFQKDRQGIIFSLEFLKKIFRDTLIGSADNGFISGQKETVSILKGKLTKQKLVDLMAVCDKLKEMVGSNANNAIIITKICYSLRQAVGR